MPEPIPPITQYWDLSDIDQGVAVGPTAVDISTDPRTQQTMRLTTAAYWSDADGTVWYLEEPTADPNDGIPSEHLTDYLRDRAAQYLHLADLTGGLIAQMPDDPRTQEG